MSASIDLTARARLPLLDIGRLDDGPEARAAFLEALRRAAREVGFFYLTGHGVPPALEARVRDVSRRFFALPEAEKLKVQMIHSPHFRGYNRAGLELTRGKPDWREQFDVHAEREALPIGPGTPPWARLQGPASDPESPLFRNVGANYLKGRLRSHPDVAQRYHADLVADVSKPVLSS